MLSISSIKNLVCTQAIKNILEVFPLVSVLAHFKMQEGYFKINANRGFTLWKFLNNVCKTLTLGGTFLIFWISEKQAVGTIKMCAGILHSAWESF